MIWDKIRTSWAVRPFAFIVKIATVFLFLGYLMLGISSALVLFQIEKTRHQPLNALPALIQKSVAEGKTKDVTTWVHFRTLAETDALIDLLKPDSGQLGSDIFFELSYREFQRQNMEEALFWSQLARYRLRFDTLRCGTDESLPRLEKILNALVPPQMQNMLQQDPALLKKSIQRVLDFDLKYPARNNPAPTCDVLNKLAKSNAPVVPQEHWEKIRLTLRSVSESALKKMDGQSPR